MLVQIFFRFNS